MERLFTYGTLSPGQPNEHMLSEISGSWESASVKGTLYPEGWGAAMGYPAIVLNDAAPEVSGFLFSSAELSAHWQRLDEFEGSAYRRELAQVKREDGSRVAACVYVLSAAAE